VFGTASTDLLRAGTKGVNMNAGETDGIDSDVSLANVESLTLSGNEGADTLSGAGGRGTGSDYPDNLTVDGGSGIDALVGGAGQNFLRGGKGGDTMTGGPFINSFFGGPGNDQEIGGGGVEDDFIADSVPDGADRMVAGGGNNFAVYSARTAGVDVSLDGKANDGDPMANGGAGEKDDVRPGTWTITGGSGDDTLTGSGKFDGFNGHAGADTINGKGGTDTVLGGDGDDVITGGSGGDFLQADAGADTIMAKDGEIDTVDGGVDVDTCIVDIIDQVTNCP